MGCIHVRVKGCIKVGVKGVHPALGQETAPRLRCFQTRSTNPDTCLVLMDEVCVRVKVDRVAHYMRLHSIISGLSCAGS